MLESPEARVVAVGRGTATVSVDAAAVCKRCAAGRGCGAGLLVARQEPGLIDVDVNDGVVLHVGDRVRLTLEPARLLRAAWLVYGLPLVGLVIAVLIASRIAAPGNDLAAVLSALLGLGAGALLGRQAMNREGCLRQFVPTVAEKAARRSNTDV